MSNTAAAAPPLPPITAQQLITNVASAEATAFSGQVQVTTDIGLPDMSALQNVLGVQAASWTSLLAGTTNVQVAADPKTGARAEIDSGTNAEVMVANFANRDAWIYSSSTNKATHITGAADASKPDATPPTDATTPPTPAGIAQKVIDNLTPSSTLTVDATQTVAGRAAYTLTVAPKVPGTLISSVTMAIDASTWMPLSAKVYSTELSGKPALSVAFTSLSYATPDAQLFAFTAPAGATVTTQDLSGSSDSTKPADASGLGTPTAKVVAGEAWSAITMVTGLPAQVTAMLADPSQLAGMLNGGQGQGHHGPESQKSASAMAGLIGQIAQQVPEGTAYSTHLGSVLITPSGHVFAGAVPVSALQAAARANQ